MRFPCSALMRSVGRPAGMAVLLVFAAGWMNDHLTDMSDAGGPSLEALTLLATLVHRVPGVWVGHAVLSNTFRHPALLAKAEAKYQQDSARLARLRGSALP